MLERWRVAVAAWLCRGTACVVVREDVGRDMCHLGGVLAAYVQVSGALADPRRVKAYRVLSRYGGQLAALVGRLEVVR